MRGAMPPQMSRSSSNYRGGGGGGNGGGSNYNKRAYSTPYQPQKYLKTATSERGTLTRDAPKTPTGATVTHFENIRVTTIRFPLPDYKGTGHWVIFVDSENRVFKGTVRQLRQYEWFSLLEFDAYLVGAEFEIVAETTKFHQRPLTLSLLSSIMAEVTGLPSDEMVERVLKELLVLTEDGTVPNSKILLNPDDLETYGRIMDSTILLPEGLRYSWFFHDALMNHPYFKSSAVKRLLGMWLGKVIGYQTTKDLGTITRHIESQPWVCFFEGCLPPTIEALCDKDLTEVQNILGIVFTEPQREGILSYYRIKNHQERGSMVAVPLDEIFGLGIQRHTLDWLCEIGAITMLMIPHPRNKLVQTEAVQDTRRFYAEKVVSEKIKAMMAAKPLVNDPRVEAMQSYLIRHMPMGMSMDQIVANCKVLESPFVFYEGGPGTGKSHNLRIAAHLKSVFLGKKTVCMTVSGKATTDHRKNYKTKLGELDIMCRQMVMENKKKGLAQFVPGTSVLDEAIAAKTDRPYVEYNRLVAEEKALQRDLDALVAGDDEDEYEDEDDDGTDMTSPSTSTATAWLHAMKSSNCFIPPDELFEKVADKMVLPELRSWAVAWNTPMTPSWMKREINLKLASAGTSLRALMKSPANAGPEKPLKFIGSPTKLFEKPIFPDWLVTEVDRLCQNLNICGDGAGDDDDGEDEETADDLLADDQEEELNNNNATDQEEAEQANGPPSTAPIGRGSPKPKILVCNMTEYLFKHRMGRQLFLDNPYENTQCIFFDEQLCSISDLAEVFAASPKLESCVLIGDDAQLGSRSTGALFPTLIQYHRRQGLMPTDPTLKQLWHGNLLARLVTNHRIKPAAQADANKAPELTDLAKALDDVSRGYFPLASDDVNLLYTDPYNNPVTESVTEESIKNFKTRVLATTLAHFKTHPQARYMTPLTEDVPRINEMIYLEKFGPDSIFQNGQLPMRVGLDIRITSKALCFGNQLYTNGDTGRITHILSPTGKPLTRARKHPSGYGGNPRELKSVKILEQKHWATSFIILDNKRLLELSRFESHSIIPGICSTVHSAQGRESPEEVLVITHHPSRVTSHVSRKMVFTGMSRASRCATVICYNKSVLEQAISNVEQDDIVSRLPDLLNFSDKDLKGTPHAYDWLCQKLGLTEAPPPPAPVPVHDQTQQQDDDEELFV